MSRHHGSSKDSGRAPSKERKAKGSARQGASAHATPKDHESSPTTSRVLGLQRAAGNAAVQRSLRSGAVQRDGVMTFEPEVVTGHVATLGPGAGASAVTRTNQIAADYIQTFNNIRDETRGALAQFETYMSFPDSASQEADFLGVATKKIVAEGFKALWEWAVKPIPGAGEIAGIVEALVEEYDRAEEAGRRVVVRDWIASQRADIGRRFGAMGGELNGLALRFQRGYDDVTRNEDPERPTGQGVAEVGESRTPSGRTQIAAHDVTVSGPGAEYLNGLERGIAQARAAAPSQDAMTQRMLETWVNQQQGQLASKGGGRIYIDGQIYLTVEASWNGSSASITSPTSAKLASREAGRTADALTKLMADTGATINDLDIRKVLTFIVVDEDSGWFSFTKDRYRTNMWYRSPDRIEERGPNFGPRVTTEYLAKANRIVPAALQSLDIGALQIRNLGAY